MVEPFPLIALSGGARERGLVHGRLAGDRIAKGAAHYGRQLQHLGFDEAGVNQLVEQLVPQMELFDPTYVEEMRAIAIGAEVAFSTVALINARTEVLKLAKRTADDRSTARALGAMDDPDGCTSIVVLPEATANGSLIHAQNWDWKVECAETGVVLHIEGDDGAPDILTFTEAGGLARSGLNSAGLSITANYLESDRDYSQIGVPLALIRRKALESQHMAHAVRAIYASRKSASNNIVLSHVDGVVFNFECAPDESFIVHPDRGILVHANHWISPVALSKLKDTGIASVPDSVYRDVRVRQLLEPKRGAITVQEVKGALFDEFQSPWSVCRPPRMSLNDNLSATVAMFVMEPARGTLDVAPLPALNREFTTYRLERPYGAARQEPQRRKSA
jgi:isopenicillin-N N-acyltransferase-like protein